VSRDEEQFLALDGLVQWTSAAITQADRLANATITISTPERFRLTRAALRTEADLFIAAAWKVLEFRKWISALGLRPSVDFSEIDKFDTQDTRDLRNMREHVVDYFQGRGNNQDRWWVETPEFKADASTKLLPRLRGDFCLSFSKNLSRRRETPAKTRETAVFVGVDRGARMAICRRRANNRKRPRGERGRGPRKPHK
jgi:hypothetical protein